MRSLQAASDNEQGGDQPKRQEKAHGERMLSFITKGESRQSSTETDDGFAQIYEEGLAIEPPLPLASLLLLWEQNPIHSACIEAVAADSVGAGWRLEQKAGDDQANEEDTKNKQRIVRDQLEQVCEMPFAEMLRAAVEEYRGIGWAAWEIVRVKDGDPNSDIEEILPFPAHTLRATKRKGIYMQLRGTDRIYFKDFGVTDAIDATSGRPSERTENVANEVLIFKRYTPRTRHYGLPRWIAAIPTIAEMSAIREYNVSWFASGGQADKNVHVTANDEGHAEDIAKAIKDQLEESKGIGHTTSITYGTDDSAVAIESLAPEAGKRDGQFRERRDDLAKEVLVAHQVPPYRIGWAELGSLGGSAAKEMLRAYRSGPIEQTQGIFEERLNKTLFGPMGFDLGGDDFKLNGIDWEEYEQDIDLAFQAVEQGVMSPLDAINHLGLRVANPDDPALARHYYKGQPMGDGVTEAVDVMRTFRKMLGEMERVVKGRDAAPEPQQAASDDHPEPEAEPLPDAA